MKVSIRIRKCLEWYKLVQPGKNICGLYKQPFSHMWPVRRSLPNPSIDTSLPVYDENTSHMYRNLMQSAESNTYQLSVISVGFG